MANYAMANDKNNNNDLIFITTLLHHYICCIGLALFFLLLILLVIPVVIFSIHRLGLTMSLPHDSIHYILFIHLLVRQFTRMVSDLHKCTIRKWK